MKSAITANPMRTANAPAIKLRWLLLLTWPAGYLLTYPYLPGYAFQYLALSTLALLSCAILLNYLRLPLAETLPVWLILTIFVTGYYIQFYLLVLDPSILEAFFAKTIVTEIDVPAYMTAYAAATAGFVALAIVGCVYLNWQSRLGAIQFGEVETTSRGDTSLLYRAAVAAGAIIIGSSILTFKYNLIGTWDRQLLPFHLEGVIDYIRLVTVPVLLMLIIYLGEDENHRRWMMAGIAMLFVFAVSDMLLRTSKGTFVSMAITLVFLRLLTGKRPGKLEISVGVILILLGIALFPFFLPFRAFRSEGMGILASVTSSERELLAAGNLPGVVTFVYRVLVLRFTGAGALLAITLRHIRPLGMDAWGAFWGPRSWGGYINVEIFDVSPKYVDNFGIAPGIVGLFYAVGGIVGAFIGEVVLFGAIMWVWSWLGRLREIPAPVSRAVFLDLMLWTIGDGTATLQMFKQMAIFAVSLALVYGLNRFGRGGYFSSGHPTRIAAAALPALEGTR